MLSITTRPQLFKDVVGQDLAVQTIRKIAKADKISTHSIVLQGSYGCGKSTLARIFAKAVNCPSFKKTGEVCNECDHCKEVMSGYSEFYQEHDAARVGNVESIKSLIEQLSFKVPDDKIRVVTLDETHACTVQAMTALLKVIEEGIPQTVFVFCTTESLMKTIMSRSCVIPVFTVPDSTMKSHILAVAENNKIPLTELQAEEIVIKAEGHIRNAMQILDHFSLVGEKAIETPYKLISSIILAILKSQPIDPLLEELSLYQTTDIAPTVSLFLKNCFLGKGAFETKVRDTGRAKALFNHFYTPQVRQALIDDKGHPHNKTTSDNT